MSATSVRFTGRLVFGLMVMALGILFTLENFGLLDAGDIIRWWPVIPLGYGLMRLTGVGSERRPIIGAVFTIIGVWFLAPALGADVFDPWEFWPVLLILLGISLVVGSATRSRLAAGGPDESGTVNAFALWSGITRKVTSQDFRGGEITAIMGGHEIDLRAAKPADGRAVIDLFVWWGGVDLRVPEDWKVQCDGLAIMGAIEDNTKPPATEPRGTLVLKGLVVMGGVEVKN